MGELRDPAAWPTIQVALHDSNPYLRYYAIQAAGQIGDPQALPDLQNLQQTDIDRIIPGKGQPPIKLATFAAEAVRQIKQAVGVK